MTALPGPNQLLEAACQEHIGPLDLLGGVLDAVACVLRRERAGWTLS
jgi:hypothetical protein